MSEARATNTYQTYLVDSKGVKIVDIKDFPALGGDPELLDTTTLSDPIETKIMGLQKLDSLGFTANYNKTDYEKLIALKGTQQVYGVWFGGDATGTPTGDLGKWEFTGELAVYVDGKGVNDVRDMKITIASSTPIEYKTGA